ncbi:PatA/PatG family cyanobactin maturation protease [Allorhizobium pseudoryzae]|uniref:PatA/PatG family cyanobactin maturation protease n=1 Tax=Allorhizobium pseudoryzae TaxID=379684 RepID=UPI003D022CDA
MPVDQSMPATELFDGGREDIVIAVLDGDADLSHPSLRGARISRIGDVPPVGNTQQVQGFTREHGTAIASLIFGQPGTSATGLAWRCRGLLRPIYRDGKTGIEPASQPELAAAIREAMAAGAQIINISGGEPSRDLSIHPVLAEALSEAETRNILVVAAAGNEGCHCAHVPALAASVLAVGAIDPDGLPLPSSNWGDHYAAHGIVAQGEGLSVAARDGGVSHPRGTSISAALVCGAAALLMSACRKAGRPIQASLVRQALVKGATRVEGSDAAKYLGGRIDLSGALAWLLPLVQPPHSPAEVVMTEIDVSDAPHGDLATRIEPFAAPDTRLAPAMPTGVGMTVAPAAMPALRPSGIRPNQEEDCPTCAKGGTEKAGPVYALGTLGYDLGSDTRRRSLLASLDERALHDPAALLKELKKPANAPLAEAITWTLSIDEVPIYVVRPSGAFAAETYKQLIGLLEDQLTDGAERISLPGVLNGHVGLPSGLILPVVVPEARGMYSWTTSELIKSVMAGVTAEKASDREAAIGNFLERVYFEIRNPGQEPQDRALNFAATQAYQVERVFENAMKQDLQLDGIEVEKSPIARPGADSWDVKLTFFNPMRRLEEARMIFRFTVDVSDVIPVMVGKVRQWRTY